MDTDHEAIEGGDPLPSPATRRRWPWVVGIAVVIVGAATIALTRPGGPADEETAATDTVPDTASVVRTDLVDESEYDGTLGRPDAEGVAAGHDGTVTRTADAGEVITLGEPLFTVDDQPVVLLAGDVPMFRDLGYGDTELSIPAAGQGTITWLPEEGTILTEGAVIARVDEVPIVVLLGDIPMYRSLSRGDEGDDVRQLEEALVRLGHDPDGDVTVDGEFTYATEAMVESWQEDLGVDETGVVSPTDLVFAPLPAQVVVLGVDVGGSVSGTSPLMTVTGGAPLTGPDVAQLEASLATLGYLAAADDVLDPDTVAAVAAFQADTGMAVDGVIGLGEVVFRPGDVRIGEVTAPVGTSVAPATVVLEAGSLDTVVRFDLPAADQGSLEPGDEVVVELPDGTETGGTVASVSSVASTDQQGNTTFEVEVALDDPAVAGDLDEAPVDVRVVSDTVEDVLAVPVTALLALAEGGYAVEVVDADGTRLVAVEPGFYADGSVEVTGNVSEGDEVVVP